MGVLDDIADVADQIMNSRKGVARTPPRDPKAPGGTDASGKQVDVDTAVDDAAGDGRARQSTDSQNGY